MGGVISAEKTNLTFKTDWYTNIAWSNSTMTWPNNMEGNLSWVFIEVANFGKDRQEDITEYTTLVITLSDFENASTAQICFQDQDGNGSPGSGHYARVDLQSGRNEIDLTTLDKGNCDFDKLQDITIYGGARTDETAQASMKILEAYFEKPDPATHEVFSLGNTITFEQAKSSTTPFVMVQDGKVFCLSGGDITYKDVSEIAKCSWTVKFEADDDNADHYYMRFYDASNNAKGYVNASVWSHTWLSGVDKNGTKGEQQDGALWTIEQLPNGKYAIRNVGDVEGSYGDDHKSQGYLAITTSGYWANHVTHFNTSGEWEFYTLGTTELPSNDPYYLGWDDLIVTNNDQVIKDDENQLVVDKRGYAPYWAETAKWTFDTPFDATSYRYVVFYAKRNVTKYGNENEETGGTLFIKDNAGVTFRQDDYTKYNDTTYPDHIGKVWMNRWNEQRATVLDLQWLANNDKFGDGSECKVLDITKIKEIGVAGTFTIGGLFFTNTLPQFSAGDYKRSFDSFDKFGTICLPYSAVCCGAQLYEISAKSANGITLAEYNGVMEAGKPYLYRTLKATKQDDGFKDENNVYFFKAGYKEAETPIVNNGLIGTFSEMTAPVGENYWILSNNALYDTEGCTGDDAVTIGANKAYINKTAITNKAANSRTFFLSYDGAEDNDATAIESTEAVEVLTEGVFYDMSGREVKNPTTGIYIVKYGNVTKKVMIK